VRAKEEREGRGGKGSHCRAKDAEKRKFEQFLNFGVSNYLYPSPPFDHQCQI